ncbi:MAG: 50S ribosomal protein L11 methyltransferase [Erythrobacter sp.]
MSESSWKLSGYAAKTVVQAALYTHDQIEEWDPDLVIAGRELAEDRPEEWVLEAWYPREPAALQIDELQALFESDPPTIKVEKLASTDWVALSQEGAQPISAGPFYVRTPNFDADPNAINFVIPAALAFGTGQHQTTAGCLEMIAQLHDAKVSAQTIADIGTGTGLLGFAALALWPQAQVTVSDIDPVCGPVVEENAQINAIALGEASGQMVMIIADGMQDAQLQSRGPYDILIANILAGPLIDLAPDFASSVSPTGSIILSGLLAGEQEAQVALAYEAQGFARKARLQNDDWAVLWFKRNDHAG